MTDKQKLIYRIIIIILVLVLVGELIYFGVKIYLNRKESTFYTVINSVVLENENNYIGVGSSDYRYSKFNKYDEGYEKATIFEIENGEIVKEVGVLKGIAGRYNDVVKTSDGYIAVGRMEMTKKQHEEKEISHLPQRSNHDKLRRHLHRSSRAGLSYGRKIDGPDLFDLLVFPAFAYDLYPPCLSHFRTRRHRTPRFQYAVHPPAGTDPGREVS